MSIKNMVRLYPGDTVYIVINRANKVVLKSRVYSITLTEKNVLYRAYEGLVVCSKSKEYPKGMELSYPIDFRNSNIGTLTPTKDSYIFTSKDKCLEFLRSY